MIDIDWYRAGIFTRLISATSFILLQKAMPIEWVDKAKLSYSLNGVQHRMESFVYHIDLIQKEIYLENNKRRKQKEIFS